MRDSHKYDWMPPDPPRIPRQQPITAVQAGITIIVALLLIGALSYAGVVIRALIRFCGWMWGAA